MRHLLLKTHQILTNPVLYYNKTIEWLNTLIDNTNIRVILITALVFLFSIFSVLKIWKPKIITKNEITQVEIYEQPYVYGNTPAISKSEEPATIKQPTKKIVEGKPNKKDKFLKEMVSIAKSESKKYKIPVSIKVAQGILESGWGEGEIVKKANNYYGIKIKQSLTETERDLIAGRFKHKTKEFSNGKSVLTVDDFVKYESRWSSVRHHSIFLKTRIDNNFNKGYSKMRNLDIKNYKAWAEALQEAKYSTNPKYAERLIKIIEKYDLDRYDK